MRFSFWRKKNSHDAPLYSEYAGPGIHWHPSSLASFDGGSVGVTVNPRGEPQGPWWNMQNMHSERIPEDQWSRGSRPYASSGHATYSPTLPLLITARNHSDVEMAQRSPDVNSVSSMHINSEVPVPSVQLIPPSPDVPPGHQDLPNSPRSRSPSPDWEAPSRPGPPYSQAAGQASTNTLQVPASPRSNPPLSNSSMTRPSHRRSLSESSRNEPPITGGAHQTLSTQTQHPERRREVKFTGLSPPSYRQIGINLHLHSGKHTVFEYEILKRRNIRSQLDNIQEIVQDLLYCSFVPLTEHLKDPKKITHQAGEFLSAFEYESGKWEINASELPRQHDELLYGLTPNSRRASPTARFLRFRFPFISFEWHTETPPSLLKACMEKKQSVVMKSLWKAWACAGSASGIVAYGFCKDALTVDDHQNLIISEREFHVIKVFQPELMTPIPYPIEVPPLPARNEFLKFSASQSAIQLLRSSQSKMTLLIAISAFVTSLKPIIDLYNTKIGLVLAALGIAAALISIISLFVGWALGRIEAIAPKYRKE